jgi:hypothetical protein
MIRRQFLFQLAAAAGKRGRAVNASPFEIRLRELRGLAVEGVLVNVSKKPQLVLANDRLQPCEPTLRDSAGKTVALADKRADMKYDNTPWRALFKALKPGEEVPWVKGRFERREDGYYFECSQFEAMGLRAGRYTLSVVWKSAIDQWVDSETRKSGRWKDIWLGELRSNQVTVTLE